MIKNNMPDISVILPCQNEEQAIGVCIDRINDVFLKNNINGEIIVSDSSTDMSPDIARKKNARLVKHDKDGYGMAYLEGFKAARANKLFLADSDGSYEFEEIPRFYHQLQNGSDLIVGNRFKGTMDEGAMPWHHRYIGNPLLSSLLRLFYGTKLGDVHCGMRAIKKDALNRLHLKTTGMEFASEMIVKAAKNKLIIKEIPINYHKRVGHSKLRSFVDGWRHLRFMLLYSPLFLFFIPGATFFSIGLVSMIWLTFGTASIGSVKLYYHPMFFSSLFMIIGYQVMVFALFAKTYAITHLGEKSRSIERLYRFFTIETGSIIGLGIFFVGVIIFGKVFFYWVNNGFTQLEEIKTFLWALSLSTLGIQTVFSSFMLSILGIKEQ